MTFNKSYEDITETLRRKGIQIEKVTSSIRFFPDNESFIQLIPVNEKIEVGATFERNGDIPILRNWLLIPVIKRFDVPYSIPADYATIKEYLEEFIVCCKCCLEAYKMKSNPDDFFGVSCGTEDIWIGENFMDIYNNLEVYWDVKCTGIVSSDSENCSLSIIKKSKK